MELPIDPHEYVRNLDDNFRYLREIAKEHHNRQVAQRTATNLEVPMCFNPGDLVLKLINKENRVNKLFANYEGPFEVVQHNENDVQVRSLITGVLSILHSSTLKLFLGTRDEAYELAKTDFEQFEIDRILYYRGQPETRSTTEFYVRFQDGSEVWQVYNNDLATTVQFEAFCRSRQELMPLIYSATIAAQRKKTTNNTPITAVQPGIRIYINLRFFNWTWYKNLQLPNYDTVDYVVAAIYDRWIGMTRKKIKLSIPIFNEVHNFTHYDVLTYGNNRELLPDQVLVDARLLRRYPQITAR
jgi:hypothetical protein